MGATPVPVTGDRHGSHASSRRAGGTAWPSARLTACFPIPYTTLAVAAAATTTLKVGTAVAVPLRHPAARRGRDGHAAGALRRSGAILPRTRRRRREGAAAEADAASPSSRSTSHGSRASSAARTSTSRACRCRWRVLDDIDPSLGVPSGRTSTSPRPARRRSRPRLVMPTGSASPSAPTSTGCGTRSAPPERSARTAGKDADALELGCFVQVAVTDSDDRARARRSAGSS